VKAAIFSGRKQEVFRNRLEFSGSILSQVNGLIEYLDYYNEVHSEIHGMRRIDSRNYPVEALREAVFNAMVHRDYGFSGSTLVSLYEDRLEILSLGGLAEGVTYQDMMMGVSIQRNSKLAEVFFRLHYIEAFGTGVHRILRAYEGCARQPEFLVSDNAVKVILPNIHYEEDVSAVDKVKEPGAVYESFARNADDIRVCEAIANGVDSRRALQETMGFSLTKTVNILRRLQDEMKVVRLGKGKNSRYSVRS
jgi:ATP-dependent DNA helicase RecG